jgi:putative hydrolase of the HAD superfamily
MSAGRSTAIEGIEHVRAIAWDFDGVLNRAGIRGADGHYRWEARVRTELGLDISGLNAHVFGTGLRALLTGQEDILDRVESWARAAGHRAVAEDILELMFEAEHDPDPDLLRVIAQLDRAGITQVIATNNDPRRTRHIAQQSGMGELVEAVFSSGEMGVMKPDAAYFDQIRAALRLEASQILLIDDLEANIDGADRRGWLGWQYTPGQALPLVQALMPLLLRAQG